MALLTDSSSSRSKGSDSIYSPTRAPDAIKNALRSLREQGFPNNLQARVLGEFALATRSKHALDLLANGAGFASVDEAFDAARRGNLSQANADWLREFGRVVYQLSEEEDRSEVVLAFFGEALSLGPENRARVSDARAHLDALLQVEGPDAVESYLPYYSQINATEMACLLADVVGVRYGSGSREWLDVLNAGVFERYGLQPISLLGGGGSLFNRLAVEGAPDSVEGPLITVIMATYQRREGIHVAVQSILNQTWTNLELIIVDDASGADFDDLFEELELTDPRIKIIRMPVNGGAYVGRNAALAVAQGEFIAFQDDDDWSHPERLERQVAVLLENEDVFATVSTCLRATEDLDFQSRASPAASFNTSSVMFPASVMERVGPYDTTRKAADTEYLERARTLMPGRDLTLAQPLAFVQLTRGSLSRSDFSVGWKHPSRTEYRESYMFYHEQLRWGLAAVPERGGLRPFPAPGRFLGEGEAKALPRAFDLVVVGDFRAVETGTDIALGAVKKAIASGARVGLAHLTDVTVPGAVRGPVASSARKLIHEGRVSRVLSTDDVDVMSVLVTDAALLEFAADDKWSWDVADVAVIARDLPVEENPRSVWSLHDVKQAAADIFGGQRLQWLAADEEIYAGLKQLEAGPLRIELEGFMSWASNVRADGPRGPLARIGRMIPPAPDEGGKFLPLVFDDGDDIREDVRLYAARGTRGLPTDTWPSSWLTYGPDTLSFNDYLAQIDFYVAGKSDHAMSLDVLPALQAVAAGCLLLAEPALEPHLGEMAIYCDSEQLSSTIDKFRDDHDLYEVQVNRASAKLLERQAETDSIGLILNLHSEPETN